MKITARSLLVIATRQIGDVLLATPLIRSLRRGYPLARLDVLVYDNTGGMLMGNPDIDRLLTVAEHPNITQYRLLVKQIFRRYDLAISTLAGDRPHLYALLAAPRRVGLVPPAGDHSGWWKRLLLSAYTEPDTLSTHTVVQNLRLADLLDLPHCYEVVPPSGAEVAGIDALIPFGWHEEPFAVLHVSPMWRYKQWTVAGWQAVIGHLVRRGLRVILTGSSRPEELAYLDAVLLDAPAGVYNLAGRLSLAQLVLPLAQARLYIGPDTAVTHLAAALGVPTLALFGPSNPVKWGPWPRGFAESRSPYVNKNPQQWVRNVLLLQGLGECVPCHEEGCERHKNSLSACLQDLPASRVITVVETLLAGKRGD
jgi:heptosyltransferase-3